MSGHQIQNPHSYPHGLTPAEYCWERLADMFPAFVDRHGEHPDDAPTWRDGLNLLTPAQVSHGLQVLLTSGREFAPSLPLFLQMAKSADRQTPTHQISHDANQWNTPEGFIRAKINLMLLSITYRFYQDRPDVTKEQAQRIGQKITQRAQYTRKVARDFAGLLKEAREANPTKGEGEVWRDEVHPALLKAVKEQIFTPCVESVLS